MCKCITAYAHTHTHIYVYMHIYIACPPTRNSLPSSSPIAPPTRWMLPSQLSQLWVSMLSMLTALVSWPSSLPIPSTSCRPHMKLEWPHRSRGISPRTCKFVT